MNKKILLAIGVLAIFSILLALFIKIRPLMVKLPPSDYADLEAKGEETLVIAGIPQLNLPEKKVFKPSWKEVEEALPEFKETGVNTIFIWTPYDAFWPEKGRTIPVKTKDGVKNLEIKNSFVIKDYIKPDPERGTEEEFLRMIETAHSLGLKVVAQLQITVAAPGGFIYDKHPDWMLKSIYGEPAIFWPRAIAPYGYIVDKSNPGLIAYVTDAIIPLWIENWGLDGIYLDSATMSYCNLYIKNLCDKEGGYSPGYECLTPVEGYYSPEPFVKAMREKIDNLKSKTVRNLTFSGEMTQKSSRDAPDEDIIKLCKGSISAWWSDPKVDRTMGEYFDWVQGYNFRGLLKMVSEGTDYSYSENYVRAIKFMQDNLDEKYTKTAKFVNMWVEAEKFLDLLKPDVAGNYITLTTTAPGNIVWIGEYQIILNEEISKALGYNPNALRNQYKKLIAIKKAFPAPQSENIEDALVSPKVKKLIAYNRWSENESVTIIVNAGDKAVDAVVKTRFLDDKGTIYDLLSGETFTIDNPSNFKITVSAYGSRILTIKR